MKQVQHRGRFSAIPANTLVIPAKAGTQGRTTRPRPLGSRFRGNDGRGGEGWRP